MRSISKMQRDQNTPSIKDASRKKGGNTVNFIKQKNLNQ